jgi:DnaJ family protein C protein 28
VRKTKDGLTWAAWVDRQVREAQERGEFDDLPGMGRPIDLTPNPYAQGQEMAFKVLQDAGFAPDWIELDKALREKVRKARTALSRSWMWREARLAELAGQAEKWALAEQRRVQAGWEQAVASFEEEAASINEEIADLNLKVPSPQFQRSKVNAAREIANVQGERCESGD